MTFEDALEFVIRWEGGYRVHRNPGEEYITFAGIYQKYHPGWKGWEHLRKGDVEGAKRHVKDFYRINYWLPLKGDYLPPKVATALFDTSVNIGLRRSVKAIQKLVGVYPDGIVGPVTLMAIRRQKVREITREFLKRRIVFYQKWTAIGSTSSRGGGSTGYLI